MGVCDADSFHHSVVPLNAVSVASAPEGGLVTAFPCLTRVWFAVIAHNGQSRTPVPTNKMFVSAIEMKFAVGVLNGASRQGVPRNERSRVLGVPRLSPPTNVDVHFGNRDEVSGNRL